MHGREENRECLKEEMGCKSTDGSSQEYSPRGVLEIPVSSMELDGGRSGEGLSLDRSMPAESRNSHWWRLFKGLLPRKKSKLRPSSSSGGSLTGIQGDDDQIGDGVPQLEIPKGWFSWRNFDYQELVDATDNFSTDKLIGKGGHAEVYKGILPDGQMVAVKKLTKGDNEERTRSFLSELGIIAHVNHPNAAQLLGFSVEEGLHLVLEYLPRGSLASVLHGSKKDLEWGIRFKIALGVAQGLLYLHEGCQRRIIHRDIKASNILLTHEYHPQISDFGIAKWLPDKCTHHIMFRVEGTVGYLAPEYYKDGVVNEKTDVFAFGVLLLELITGRRAVDSSGQSLAIWANRLLEAGHMKELIDPSLLEAYNPEELRRAVYVASMCIHKFSTSRPNMNRVVRFLRGEESVAEFVGNEPRQRPLFDDGDSEDYTCSKYLSDLDRHKQLALEE